MERRYAHLQQVKYCIDTFIEKMNDGEAIKKAATECMSRIKSFDGPIDDTDEKIISELENIAERGGFNATTTLLELRDLINKLLSILSRNPEKIPNLKLSSLYIEKINDGLIHPGIRVNSVVKGDKYKPFMLTLDETTDRILVTLETMVYDDAMEQGTYLEPFFCKISSIPDYYEWYRQCFRIGKCPKSSTWPNPYRAIYGIDE